MNTFNQWLLTTLENRQDRTSQMAEEMKKELGELREQMKEANSIPLHCERSVTPC